MTDIEILKEGIKALDSKKADDIKILKVRCLLYTSDAADE